MFSRLTSGQSPPIGDSYRIAFLNSNSSSTPDRERAATNRPFFLNRVRIKNYRSIGTCDVELGEFTVLVGRNGAGKSNFLDALRFLVDGLETSLDHALKSRGGIADVRRRSTGHPRNFGVEVDLTLPDQMRAKYGFEIASRPRGGFVVKREMLTISNPATGKTKAHYRVAEGEVVSASVENAPPAVDDRLYLVTAAGLPEFRDTYDALGAMRFYNMNPESMKELQSPDAGEFLRRDGSNIASVVGRSTHENPGLTNRINEYMSKIVRDIEGFHRVALGPKETLELRQKVQGAAHPWKFFASSMSDGTLRALGALVAVAQYAEGSRRVGLVGIEEPETALHPAASGALMDALSEAASQTQVIVTSHSPDLLDELDLRSQSLLVVVSREGTTKIASVDAASRSAINDHLYSAGDLLRMDQLAPDEEDLKRQEQLPLFSTD